MRQWFGNSALWATTCCLLLTCVAQARAQFLSPGELSASHATLEGDKHCLDCHASGRRVDAQLCLKCHTDIGASLRASSGLHGKQYKGKACEQCHVDHRGKDYDLVRWPGGARTRFDHLLTGFALRDAHARLACNQCHQKKNTRGAPTMLGVGTRCNDCHEDKHDKRFGLDCAKCHVERTWTELRLTDFDHALARFKLVGKHKDVKCAKCHGEPPAAVKYKPLEFGTCTSCHKDPHKGRFSSDCTTCHSETDWKDLHMRKQDHPGLSLAGGHDTVACARCHDRGNDEAPSKGKRCVGCHAPVHEANFGNDCVQCHAHIRWLGLADDIGRKAHELTKYPLAGAHQKVDCARCHKPELPQAKRYRALPFARCLDCHVDSHKGEFSARDGGECAQCHRVSGFLPTRFDTDAHASTPFPLLGRHLAVACGSCHKQPARPRLDWHVADTRCESCHENPHGEQFAAEMKDNGCAHCHAATDWHAPRIDHSRWPLTGAHATTACARCHDPSEADRKSGRGASYRGVPTRCEGCHEDKHRGQFRLTAPVRACEDCHKTSSFQLPSFDHQQMTGFALDGKHAPLACKQCHKEQTLRNGETTVRYRLGYQRCSDCHANPHAEAAP